MSFKKSLPSILSVLLISTLMLVGMRAEPAYAATWSLCYVKVGASGSGSSWNDAYPDLQSALADSNCTEIWVAQGTYYPDEGTGQSDDDRTSTFTLKSGVAIYGGFDGTETAQGQRDPATNTTTLSGCIKRGKPNTLNG